MTRDTNLVAAAVTHTDYIWQNLLVDWVKRGAPGGAEYFGVDRTPTETVEPWEVDPDHFWSEAGVRRLIDRCADRGVNRIYWRTFAGGKALYTSRIAESVDGKRRLGSPSVDPKLIEAGLADYTTFDALPIAIEHARGRGVEIYAWYTGCEDDHGNKGHVRSRFAKEHPELLQENRTGEKLPGNLSFAFDAVIDYKRSLLEEFLEYGFDGLMLDCSRENSFSHYRLEHPIARHGQQRVPQGGYEAPVREAFEAQYGKDPRRIAEGTEFYEIWWRFRSQYYPTPLVQLCAEQARGRGIPFEVLVRRRDNFETYGLDLEHWLDAGWLDAICPIMPGLYYPGATHGYYLDETSDLAGMFQRIQQLARGRCAVRWLNYLYPLSAVLGYHGKVRHAALGIPASRPPGPLLELMRGRVATAKALGADGLILFEGNHMEAWGLWDALG